MDLSDLIQFSDEVVEDDVVNKDKNNNEDIISLDKGLTNAKRSVIKLSPLHLCAARIEALIEVSP